MAKMKREDLVHAIWHKDKDLKLKDIRHILELRETAIVDMLSEGNSLKDGKLVQFDYVDKPEREHYNGFANDGKGAKIILPSKRVFSVRLSNSLKAKINRNL